MNPKRKSVVFRSLLVSLSIVLLTFLALFVGNLYMGKTRHPAPEKTVQQVPPYLRALTVPTANSAFFDGDTLQTQLSDLVSFAGKYGYNALFFEVAPEGNALFNSSRLVPASVMKGHSFDPFAYLVDICRKQNIQVYAVIDPFTIEKTDLPANSPAAKNPSWVMEGGVLNPAEEGVIELASGVAAELYAGYDIAGVLFSGVDTGKYDHVPKYADQIAALLATVKTQIEPKFQQRLGIVVRADAIAGNRLDLFSKPLADGSLDFVVTSMGLDPVSEEALLKEQLKMWRELCQKTGAAFYPLHAVSNQDYASHQAENSAWLEKQAGASGIAISSYHTLKAPVPLAAISLAASFRQEAESKMPDFAFPQTFQITRPTETLTLDPSWKSYFVTGTSVPGKPLYCGDTLIETTENGLWGHLVSLSPGENTFTFIQDGIHKNITINLVSTPAIISDIRKSSIYPANAEAILPGMTLKLSCVAPYGGTVTASINGLRTELKPVTSADQGTPVSFQASLDISPFAQDGMTSDLGKVTYVLTYNGINATHQSEGSVFVTGQGAQPVAKMRLFASTVNESAADNGQYRTILRKDCVDYITENVGSYYGLSSGGYILKSAVDIIAGDATAVSDISRIALKKSAKGEKMVISGTVRPSYAGLLTDTALQVTIYNISGWETMNTLALNSSLCDVIRSQQNDDGSVTLNFQFKPDAKIAGWDVLFEGNDMIIYLKEKPPIDWDMAAPLSPVTIVLDPGHGGSDPGAMGIPGKTGLAEHLLNLANSYALRSRLEALGATVHILQEDTDRSLNERLELAQKFDADLFISSHHNSLSEAADSNNVSGIEVYYWNGFSQQFAQNIGQNLSLQTGRKLRFIEQSWYRVTMMTACPSVLVESGFICNPSEYEGLLGEYAMYRYANAVADAVLQYFLPSPEP